MAIMENRAKAILENVRKKYGVEVKPVDNKTKFNSAPVFMNEFKRIKMKKGN